MGANTVVQNLYQLTEKIENFHLKCDHITMIFFLVELMNLLILNRISATNYNDHALNKIWIPYHTMHNQSVNALKFFMLIFFKTFLGHDFLLSICIVNPCLIDTLCFLNDLC